MDLQVFKFKDTPCHYDYCVPKHKIAPRKCVGFTYLLQKDTRTVAISFECLIFCEKLEDIK